MIAIGCNLELKICPRWKSNSILRVAPLCFIHAQDLWVWNVIHALLVHSRLLQSGS